MNTDDKHWWKSSRSNSEGGACVEVAGARESWFVRDSKDRDGGILSVAPGEWHAFVAAVRSDRLR